LFVTQGGNVGIGKVNPLEKLDVLGVIRTGNASSVRGSIMMVDNYGSAADGNISVYGTEYVTGASIIGYSVKPSSSAVGSFLASNPYGTERAALVVGAGSYGNGEINFLTAPASAAAIGDIVPMTSRFLIKNSGNVGIGNTTPGYKLHVAGDVGATAFTVTSDERFKKDIKDIMGSDELAKFSSLSPKTYTWNEQGIKEGGKENQTQYGFLAQEVEQQYPELVTTRADGYKGVNYTGFIPVLVAMVQTLIETVSKMADEIVTKVVKTELLCVGSECLNEEQIRQIKNNSGVSGAPVVPTSTPTSAPSWTTDPATTTATTTEPTTSPIVEPSTTTEPIVETPTSEPETTPEPTPVEPVATSTTE
jgi:hypothetical protein